MCLFAMGFVELSNAVTQPVPTIAPASKPVTIAFPARSTLTALRDFGRNIRDEPLYYLYKFKVYFKNEDLSSETITAWLRKRYTDHNSGNRYLVREYRHKDGGLYVNYILMETLSEADTIEMTMRGWQWTLDEIRRGNRVKRRRLNPEQRKRLDVILAEVQEAFYNSL